MLDFYGEVLRYTIEARPVLIKPNRYELETLIGRELGVIEPLAVEARGLQRRGISFVCVSLGSEGALLVGEDNTYYARAPGVAVASTVGAGDSMVAALVAAFAHGLDPLTPLRLAVACSTGTVRQPGAELFFAADLDMYFDAVTVSALDI